MLNSSSQNLSWYHPGLAVIAAQFDGAAVVGAGVLGAPVGVGVVVGAAVVGGEGADPPQAVGAATI